LFQLGVATGKQVDANRRFIGSIIRIITANDINYITQKKLLILSISIDKDYSISIMIRYERMLLIILLFAIFTLQAQVQPDSIISHEDGTVIAYVYERNQSLQYDEFRFFNSKGFYCLSLYREIGNEYFYYLGSKSVNTDEDLVFLADTFEIGFLNHFLKNSGNNFNTKFENTVHYYYSSKDYRNDSRLKAYIDSITEKYNISIPKPNKGEKDAIILPTPTIRYRDLIWFKYVLLDKVRINKRLKNKLNSRIDFAIYTDPGGRILNIERLSFLRSRRNKKIDKNIANLIGEQISPGPARGDIKFKGAFFIEID